jgi:uncharacterized protein (DUF2132 family)
MQLQKMDKNNKPIPNNDQSTNKSNDPLHGIKLADILETLVERRGWEKMAKEVNINCFKTTLL